MFPIVALQEMGVANISRLDVIWEPITSHLSQVQYKHMISSVLSPHELHRIAPNFQDINFMIQGPLLANIFCE